MKNARPIKFRAWEKVQEDMKYGVEFDLSPILPCPELWELMQFTGLLDKNGKEIYEGDIIKYYEKRHEGGQDVVFEQVFEVQVFEDYLQFFDFMCNYPLADKDTIEIIGNIYENPELLNERKI